MADKRPRIPREGFLARFTGDCPRCDRGIRPGDPVIRTRRDDVWIHASCASGQDDE